MTRPQIELILAASAPLRDRVLWTLLYETAARAEEALSLNVTDLDTANRCAVVTRKGGARDVLVWQTWTARLLPRLLVGRRCGPLFVTDRATRPSVALVDVDPTTGKPGCLTDARPSCSKPIPPACPPDHSPCTNCGTPH